MRSIRRILVAVKEPRASSPALAKATRLAKALGAQIRLFHALTEPIYLDLYSFNGPGPRKLEDERYRAALAKLDALANGLRRLKIRVSTSVEWDYPAHEAVLRAARAFGADLIVADAHPTRHHAAWLLRFTDWELLRRSSAPVLLVKSSKPYRRPRVLAAVDPSHAFAKPLELDEEILRTGSAVAGALRGQLHAVYAYDSVPLGLPPVGPASSALIAAAQAAATGRAKAVLDRAVRKLRVPLQRRHLVARHPTDAIIDAVRETRCGIVVMGAISRSGLNRFVVGNTAERVLDRLACDVLIVKPKDFRTRIRRTVRGPQLVAPPVPQI